MCGMAGLGVLGHSRLAVADLVTQFAVKRTGACRHNRSPQLSASRSPFLDLSALARAEFALGQSLRREQLRSHPLARLPVFLLPEGAGHPGVDVLDFDDGIGHGARSLQLRPKPPTAPGRIPPAPRRGPWRTCCLRTLPGHANPRLHGESGAGRSGAWSVSLWPV